MILAYILAFRITTKGKLQQDHRIKPNYIYSDCSNLVDFKLVKNNLATDNFNDSLCEREAKLIRCQFGRFKIIGQAYQHPLFYTHRYNFYSEYCNFFEILLNRAIVSTGTKETGNEDKKITISHWTISNCYTNDYMGHYIYCLAGYLNVNNLTTYSNAENIKSGRVFYVNYHKNCSITNCRFENQHHQQTAGVLINCSKKGTINLKNCAFINCQSNQNSISMLRLNEVFYDLVIENCTFEKSNYYEGDENDEDCMRFFINVDTVRANHSLTFKNCLFSKLEINSCCGGGIGLMYFQRDFLKVNLIFDKTNFEHIYSDNFGGGVINVHNSNEDCNNDNCDVFIYNCFFENISSVGVGGAVYFCSSQNFISITESTFKKSICEEQGHSIYIDNDDYDKGISILNCNFIDCGVEKSRFVVFVNSKTATVENCQIEFTNELGCGGIFVQCNSTIVIKDTQLIQTSSEDSALKIVSFGASNSIKVSNCIFDKCEGINYSFFEINIMTETFIFENIFISNSKRYKCDNYGGIISFINEISILKLTNITFSNNTYASLYGGGVGIMIKNVNKLLFNKCCFFSNEARQDFSIKRPSESHKKNYYNGDGGGIQLGYFCETSYMDVTFDNCIFANNRAARHGGAIAIQTLGKVEIINCQFLNNTANYNFHSSSSSILLVENYFDLKNGGRGGAIYINPSYTYEDDSLQCSPPNKFMTDVTIKDSEFELNTGFDGFGIYIEGDDLGTNFSIENNNFIDNFNLSNYDINTSTIPGGVIATEIHSVKINQDPLKKNNFSSSNNIKVNEIIYVDHYGNTPSKEFTHSKYFSNSNYFSKSLFFTNSDLFSESLDFTETNYFSNSDNFSPSKYFSPSEFFSQSKQFSGSKYFSESNQFSKSEYFSSTEHFSKSKHFDPSKQFSQSKQFSKSKYFSRSKCFSSSKYFSKSKYFSQSKHFSQSKYFNPSDFFIPSKQFSESKQFSRSECFSESEFFTETQIFSKSVYFTNSKAFSDSDELGRTTRFTKSIRFTNSKIFSKSEKFSETRIFTESELFSETRIFTNSELFSETRIFTNSELFSETGIFTKSELFSETKIFSDSNEFSYFYIFSKSSTSDEFHENSFSTIILPLKTSYFTKSSIFTQSDTFTKSDSFTKSSPFTTNAYLAGDFTFSMTITMTFIKRRSVSMSLSYSSSNSFLFSYISELGTYSFIFSNTNILSYFPYIIYYYSPSYQATCLLFSVYKIKQLTKEQLIGITCGSSALFFSIVAIVILFIRKKYKVKDYLFDYSESSGKEIMNKRAENKKEDKELIHDFINTKDDSDIDIDFWI